MDGGIQSQVRYLVLFFGRLLWVLASHLKGLGRNSFSSKSDEIQVMLYLVVKMCSIYGYINFKAPALLLISFNLPLQILCRLLDLNPTCEAMVRPHPFCMLVASWLHFQYKLRNIKISNPSCLEDSFYDASWSHIESAEVVSINFCLQFYSSSFHLFCWLLRLYW